MTYIKADPVPVLYGYALRDGRARVWCEHEGRWHTHGDSDGHRVAHCVCPESPYKEDGYTLIVIGLWAERPAHSCGKRHSRMCAGNAHKRQWTSANPCPVAGRD